MLSIYPNNSSFLRHFEGDAVLAFLLIELNRSREEKVECVGCSVTLASHKLVGIEI